MPDVLLLMAFKKIGGIVFKNILIYILRQNLLPDMPSDPSLLADMQNLAICWWTLWFLTNLLVDIPSNKILISRCCGERKAVKCPICPCPFFYTSFFFPICSEQHRVLPSPSPSSPTAPPSTVAAPLLRAAPRPPSPSEQHHGQAGPPPAWPPWLLLLGRRGHPGFLPASTAPVWTEPTPASRTRPRSICSSRTRRVRVAAPLTACT